MNVKLYLDNLKVIRANGEVTIPLNDIHTLIIDNQQLTITVPLINKCSKYNVNLIFCSQEHLPQTILNPISGNYQAPLMLKKQFNWSINIKKELHKLIIKNKIDNQISLLEYYKKNSCIDKLKKFCREVTNGDTLNREGLSAKIYFRELFGDNFKRFNDDVMNAGLNYGYAILRSQISKTLIAKGLNPSIGIIHIGYDNPFNLSDDIIEVFRPIIDRYVYDNLREAILFKREHRMDLISQTTKSVFIDGQRQTIFNAMGIYIDKIIDVFELNDSSKFEKITLIYDV